MKTGCIDGVEDRGVFRGGARLSVEHYNYTSSKQVSIENGAKTREKFGKIS